MTAIRQVPYASIRGKRGRCFHAARSMGQADLFEIEWEGRPALLKDFSDRPWFMRVWFSRFIAAREVRALTYLQGVPGIPQLYATAGSEAFIMERLDGVRLPKKDEAPPPPQFWERARTLMDQLHDHGVGHGDLRRKNILLGPGGEAFLIDFATASFRKGDGRAGGLANFIYRRYCRVDNVTFARIKASYGTVALDEEELGWLADEPWFLRVGRVLKKRVYRLRKGSFWSNRLHKLTRWVRYKIFGYPEQ